MCIKPTKTISKRERTVKMNGYSPGDPGWVPPYQRGNPEYVKAAQSAALKHRDALRRNVAYLKSPAYRASQIERMERYHKKQGWEPFGG